MQTLSDLEEHTARFNEWEISGRGWKSYPYLVPLEPAFRPFPGHRSTSVSVVDDGRRHTILSAFRERLFGGASRPETPELQSTDEAPPPEVDVPEAFLEETELLIPPNEKVDPAVTTSLLRAVSGAEDPISFELMGRGGRVSIRFASSAGDTPLVRSQLATFLPNVSLVEPELDLVGLWHNSDGDEVRVVEFGLEREFMLPLRDSGKIPDPLTPFIAAFGNTQVGDLAIVQILFTPALAPWAEAALDAVVSPDGEPFFIDSPELSKLAAEKFSTPLFAVVVRVLVRVRNENTARDILSGIFGGMKQYAARDRNAFVALKAEDPDELQYNILLRSTNRSGMLLSLSELAGLARIPGADVRTSALVREPLPQLPAELIKGDGVVIGMAEHGDDLVPAHITTETRSKHVYVVGASGTGKSTLLENLIIQDIHAGHGFGVVDLHGDLIDDLLSRIPDDRIQDVVLFDPSDPDWVVGWNILGAHSQIEKELLASDLVAAFQRLSTSWGDQMSTVLGNAILTFLESRTDGTLIDLRKFLLDADFRKAFLSTVSDENTRSFWDEEFPLLVGRKPQAPILTRLNGLLRSRPVREAVVEREKPLNFREIIDEKKIFLAKLSQGAIGEENAALLGSLLVSKFHQIALSRQDTAESEREPFFLYIDEFQNVATPSMASLFSGIRKYKLSLCVAHQDLYQLHSTAPELERSILANVHSRILFRVSEEDAKKVERGMGRYTAEDLVSLDRGEAICRVGKGSDAFRLKTLPLDAIPKSEAEMRREYVRRESLTRYGRPRTEQAAGKASEPTSVPVAPKNAPGPNNGGQIPPGRGGRQHRYLQSLLKRVGEERGFAVTTESRVLDGHGHVDVFLARDGLSIGCEISVSTSVKHELGNLSKCLAAGLDYAVLVSSAEGRLRSAERQFVSELAPEDRERVRFLTPEAFIRWLDGIRAEAYERSVATERSKKAEPVRRTRVKKEAPASPKIDLNLPTDGKQMLNAQQAAAYVCRAPQTLAKLRCIGGGPPYYKVGRNIFYEHADLDAWLDSQKRRSTSEQVSVRT